MAKKTAASRSGRAARPALRRDARQQASDHRQTRAAHRQELTEDYIEVIADLIDSTGEARVVDIATRLGVSHVTVTRMIDRLQRDALVNTQPYRAIFLTEAGRALAERIRHRHEIVVRFLISIGVAPHVAHADAEGIEHHVSDETLRAFERVAATRAAPVPQSRRRTP